MAVTMIDQKPGCGPPAPVPILQWTAEFEVLLDLYRRLEPADVLEVGTYHGGTLYHWLQNTSRPGARIVTVDSYAVGVDNRDLYDGWIVNDTRLAVVAGDSHAETTLAQVQTLGPYDFVLGPVPADGAPRRHPLLPRHPDASGVAVDRGRPSVGGDQEGLFDIRDRG